MPGPGPYGNKVPPNLKKVRRVANRYAKGRITVARLSGMSSPSPRRQIKRDVVSAILDRRSHGGNDGLSWKKELGTYRQLIRRDRKAIKELKNRPPLGDAPTKPL